jgi:hypothetical protein
VLIVLTVVGALFAWRASVLINPSAGYIVVIGVIGHYMVYETFHFCWMCTTTGSSSLHWRAQAATLNLAASYSRSP